MSWFGERDHKTFICDYCGDEVDADNAMVLATWRSDGSGLDFCSQECAEEFGINGFGKENLDP